MAKLRETAEEIRKLTRSVLTSDAELEDKFSDIVDALDVIADLLESLHSDISDLAR
jgi:hypothetical protein